MNQYELGIVLRSTLTEEEVSQVIENVKSRIAELGGECTGTNLWGKRRLAHPINKQTEGIYVFFNFSLSPQSVKELVRTVQFLSLIHIFATHSNGADSMSFSHKTITIAVSILKALNLDVYKRQGDDSCDEKIHRQ